MYFKTQDEMIDDLPNIIKPLDTELLELIFQSHETIVTLEDGTIMGGFGSAILEFAAKRNYKNDIIVMGIPDTFVAQGSTEELFSSLDLTSNNLIRKIRELLS